MTKSILEDLCNEFRGQVIGDSVVNWAQGFIYPAFPQTKVIAFRRL